MASTPAPYRELTPAAMVLGVLLGACMTAAFVFIALKLGFTLPGSTVAAILGFAVLRGALGKGSIVENNINQTIASGINTASSGVAFTLPALFLMSENDPSLAGFSPVPFLLAAIAGSFLGIVLIIPLRKQMIEFERLRFPSGIAVASLLKSPGAGARQAKLLGAGFAISAAVHASMEMGLFGHEIDPLGLILGGALPGWFPTAIGVSFASLGAGLLSGRGGLPFVLGGLLAWWLIAPIAVSSGWVPSAESVGLSGADYDGWLAGAMYGTMLRPLGIGVLIGGALSGVIASFPALKSAVASLSAATKIKGAGGASTEPQEVSARVLYIGLIGAVIGLFLAALLSTDTVTVPQAIAIAIVGTGWLALAGLIVAQATGMTDISPLSGLALIAVTLMFVLTKGNVIASVMLGVAVCIGIGQCADMMSDLKSGHLVGAMPKRQQQAQFMVSWLGAPIAIGTVFLLWGDGGGFGPGTDLTAPQAGALQAIIESLQTGDSAVDKYAAGAAIGLGLGIYPIGGLGVLVGLAMYLPLYITLTYGVGCLSSIALQKKNGPRWYGSTLVPVAAGFIVGEALTSLFFVLGKLAFA